MFFQQKNIKIAPLSSMIVDYSRKKSSSSTFKALNISEMHAAFNLHYCSTIVRLIPRSFQD